jgi:hypothetical protein
MLLSRHIEFAYLGELTQITFFERVAYLVERTACFLEEARW